MTHPPTTTNNHGGKRANAGRKPLEYRTVVIRIPAPCLETVKKIVEDFKKSPLDL